MIYLELFWSFFQVGLFSIGGVQSGQNPLHNAKAAETVIHVGQRHDDDAGRENTANRGNQCPRQPRNLNTNERRGVYGDGAGGDFGSRNNVRKACSASAAAMRLCL